MSIVNRSNLKKIIQRDLRVIWHPCTQMKDHEKIPLIPIKSGKGVWLEDYDGKKYIDAISSWWVNLFGHSNTYINNKNMIISAHPASSRDLGVSRVRTSL